MAKCQYVNLGEEYVVFTVLFFELFKRLSLKKMENNINNNKPTRLPETDKTKTNFILKKCDSVYHKTSHYKHQMLENSVMKFSQF